MGKDDTKKYLKKNVYFHEENDRISIVMSKPTKTRIVHRGRWTNGAGFETSGIHQIDESGDPVFRLDGREDDFFVDAIPVIGLESFRWDAPIEIPA